MGFFSDENRVEIEAEIEKIKEAALKIVQEIVRDHEDEISTFTNDHLIKNEIMVRSEIIGVLKEIGVEPGKYYEKMCNSLGDIGYPV